MITQKNHHHPRTRPTPETQYRKRKGGNGGGVGRPFPPPHGRPLRNNYKAGPLHASERPIQQR